MLRLWGRPNSICTQRVLWACAESGVNWELELASGTMGHDGHISRGATPYGLVNTEAYRAMNPNGTVPTMDDDGLILWDSIAIVTHVAMKYGPQVLYGQSPELLSRSLQWMCWTNEHLEPLLHTLVMELVRLTPNERDAAALEGARIETIKELALIEQRLTGCAYLAGDTFSMGDIPAGATVYRWLLFDLDRPSMPNLEGWQARLQDRRAFQEHIAPRQFHL
ncbi:MAG: glutathione S-transferase family protein [Hyphomicrobiaceae bacterium]